MMVALRVRRLLRPLLLAGVALLLGGGSCRGSSSHSLHNLIWAIWEPGWGQPVVTSLAYVEDHLSGPFNNQTGKCIPEALWTKVNRGAVDDWVRRSRQDLPSSLSTDLRTLKNLFNQSSGMQTLQVFSGCELSGDNRTSRGFVNFTYNGRDVLSLDLATLNWTAVDSEATPIKRKWDAKQDRGKVWKHFLMDTCVDWLRTHQRRGKISLTLDGYYQTWITATVETTETCRKRLVTSWALLNPPYIILEKLEDDNGQGVKGAVTESKVGSLWECAWASWPLVILVGAEVIFHIHIT